MHTMHIVKEGLDMAVIWEETSYMRVCERDLVDVVPNLLPEHHARRVVKYV